MFACGHFSRFYPISGAAYGSFPGTVLTVNTEPLADMLLSTSMEVDCNATKIWEVGPKERQTRDAQTKARNVKVRKERHYESKKQKASDRYRTFRGSQKGRQGASKKIAYFFFLAALAPSLPKAFESASVDSRWFVFFLRSELLF